MITNQRPFNQHELQVLSGAIQAVGLVGNGHFLPSPGRMRAARKLIERGFLTDVTDAAGLVPNFGDWLVVKITREQYDRAQAALAAVAAEGDG
jgi:hypothetical protein